MGERKWGEGKVRLSCLEFATILPVASASCVHLTDIHYDRLFICLFV